MSSQPQEENFRCCGSMLGNFNLAWTLKNASEVLAVPGKTYKSPFFKLSELKLFLSIQSGGNENEDEGYVLFIFFDYQAPPKYQESGISLTYTASIRNTSGKTLKRMHSNWEVCHPCDGSGFRIKNGQENILNKLVDDKLIIQVEGMYSLSAVMGSKGFLTDYFNDVSPFAKMAEDYKESLDQSENSADAHICVEGVELPVETSILSARSKVFAAMFIHETSEKAQHRVEIDDFGLKTIKSMIQFIYCGRVSELSFKQALELLRAADKYDLDDLKTLCSNFLIPHMEKENLVEILVCADSFNAERLRSKAIEYFREKRASIDIDEYKTALRNQPNVLYEIVKALKEL